MEIDGRDFEELCRHLGYVSDTMSDPEIKAGVETVTELLVRIAVAKTPEEALQAHKRGKEEFYRLLDAHLSRLTGKGITTPLNRKDPSKGLLDAIIAKAIESGYSRVLIYEETKGDEESVIKVDAENDAERRALMILPFFVCEPICDFLSSYCRLDPFSYGEGTYFSEKNNVTVSIKVEPRQEMPNLELRLE